MSDSSETTALITGASRGLGLEIARLFARQGISLILTARGSDALASVARELEGVTEVLAVAGDVADSSHAQSLIRQGLERFGAIDILINNASELGPSPMPELAAISNDALERIFAVNLLAPLQFTQLVLPGMRARGRGIIINVSSDAGVEAYPTWGGYGSSKAALEHASRVLAAELAGTEIRVYVVDPGDMNTQMHRDAEPGEDLSHLPPASASAPAFVRLLEKSDVQFGRFVATELIAGDEPGARHDSA